MFLAFAACFCKACISFSSFFCWILTSLEYTSDTYSKNPFCSFLGSFGANFFWLKKDRLDSKNDFFFRGDFVGLGFIMLGCSSMLE